MKMSYLKGAGLLVFGTFVAKFVGAFYRIPLTNIVGAEGLGIYQLIFPIYSLLLSSSTGALPLSISIIVARHLAAGDKEKIRNLINATYSILMMSGLLMSVGLMILSGTLANFQGNSLATLGYIAIAPSILFVSGIAVLRGYFQGTGVMAPSALSQIIEAVVKLIFGLSLAHFLLPYGIQYAIMGALLGVTLSEFATFLAMYIYYHKKENKLKLVPLQKEAKSLYKELLAISIPITIGGIILPFVQFIDSILVINLLVKFGEMASIATASYGLLTGPVSSLINLPIIVGLSLGVAVVPALSRVKQERDIMQVKNKSDTAIKLSLMIGIPCTLIYALLAPNILNLLYPSLSVKELAECSLLLQVSSISIVLLAMMQIFTSILQGLDKTKSPVINLCIAAVVKVILNIVLLKEIGIVGVSIASIACYGIACVLNMISVVKLIGKVDSFVKNTSLMLLASVIMSALILGVNYFTSGNIATILAIFVGFAGYFLVVFRTNIFHLTELESLPFSKFFIRLSGKRS